MKEYIVPVPDQFENELFKGDHELIRCKDCVKCGTDDCAMHFEINGGVYQWNGADDFCSFAEKESYRYFSYAERKEE